jgi:hypothetical protein
MLKIPNLYQNHLYIKLKFNEYGIEKLIKNTKNDHMFFQIQIILELIIV